MKKTIKYSLVLLSIWGLTACSNGRVITINQGDTYQETRHIEVPVVERPIIQEEVLLGSSSRNNNTSLGNRVDVPSNNPSLGAILDNSDLSADNPTVSNEIMQRMDFPVSEYSHVRKKGRSTVSGKIYVENSHTSLKIMGKKVKLWLNPVTSYSRQWYEESYLGGYKLSKTDKRLYNYLKFTYSNNSGSFNFFGVPSGNYYLTGTISCADECGYNDNKSIRLVQQVYVGSGVTKVDLSKNVP